MLKYDFLSQCLSLRKFSADLGNSSILMISIYYWTKAFLELFFLQYMPQTEIFWFEPQKHFQRNRPINRNSNLKSDLRKQGRRGKLQINRKKPKYMWRSQFPRRMSPELHVGLQKITNIMVDMSQTFPSPYWSMTFHL